MGGRGLLTLVASVLLVTVLAGCAEEEPKTEIRYVRVPAAPAGAPPVVEDPDYPSCFAAREGELCEEFGRVKVKEPDYPSCALADEGEMCEEYGTVKVKAPEITPCYLAQPGEVCEEYGTVKVKEDY